MTPPPVGDRDRRAAAASVASGARADYPYAAHASRTRPSALHTRRIVGSYSLTKSGSASGGQLSELVEHLALAVTRHVRHLRQEGLQVPPSVDELGALLVRCAQTRPKATHVDHVWTTWSRAAQDDPVTGRLLVSKAEAAELLGVSVRTVERLIAAGQLRLLHIERASRLRLADIEAYVESLIGGQAALRQGDHES